MDGMIPGLGTEPFFKIAGFFSVMPDIEGPLFD